MTAPTTPTASTVAPTFAPTSTIAPTPPARVRERLVSLDVFRGLTIAGMLLVNNPGDWGHIYPPLEHATWNGWTPTDLIFPFFLFIVGITTHLSLSSRRARGATDGDILRQIFKRGGLIVLIGLLLSGIPYHQFEFTLGPLSFSSVNPPLGVHDWRFTGVLQRIGVVYIVAALLTLRTSLKQQIAILAALLLGYWFAMTLIPVPGHGLGMHNLNDASATLGAFIDRTVFGTNHLWKGSVTWDPEGLFSTVPAIGTAMLGVIAGRWIASSRPILDRISALFAFGAMGMVAGLIWNWVFPINKSLWTSSYVLFTAGMACVTLATCMWLIDVKRISWGVKPLVVFGLNPLFAFVGEGFIGRFLQTLLKVNSGGQPVSLQVGIDRALFGSWLSPVNASLAFAICFVLVFYAMMWELQRRNIVFKV
ncbi:MAG TPA: heparan-alpha-glucosaminide N-acetyltransferase domain-containing protein [Gemmatimonadaceae bacterium]|nr:heparan-alpha-glucosaminide N-acetyltransferase domain-containing protein [Gemmatimonadaceae bacterium]